MMDSTSSLAFISWAIWMVASILGILITVTILRREIRKRNDGTCKFESDCLRITSIVSLWSGVAVNISLLIRMLPGFCMMDAIPMVISFAIQFISLGFYQLSRLHYCFSRDRVHSDKGYPFWIFKVMIVVGMLIGLSWILNFIIVDPFTLKCGFGAGSESFFYLKESQHSIALDGMLFHFSLSISLCAQIWDITTLLMYIYKIWKIGTFYKSRDNNIWNNILSVLHRIVIITLFYQIVMFVLTMIRYFIGLVSELEIVYSSERGILGVFLSNLWSLSVYLMMEHNTKEYCRFLRFLKKFHLSSVCFCCCRHIVDRQWKELETADQARKLPKVQSDVTVFTNNADYKTPNPRKSVETVTVLHMDTQRDP